MYSNSVANYSSNGTIVDYGLAINSTATPAKAISRSGSLAEAEVFDGEASGASMASKAVRTLMLKY